ncbi:MAG: TetR/AcrR family transcriptional regulator [Thermoleophilaceae bacterium]
MTPTALKSRNATEQAILAAAREALAHDGYERVTIDGIAKRAFVSRTSVYFYFTNKRAVIDRLIQGAFSDIYSAASPYFDGEGDPRAELRSALARVVSVVNRNADLLLLAARLYGQEDFLPPEWEPYIRRLVVAAEHRIQRDQERGAAPADISPRVSAQALTAMVERHITVEVVRGGGSATESIRVLAELWWRAVYSFPGGPPSGAPSA